MCYSVRAVLFYVCVNRALLRIQVTTETIINWFVLIHRQFSHKIDIFASYHWQRALQFSDVVYSHQAVDDNCAVYCHQAVDGILQSCLLPPGRRRNTSVLFITTRSQTVLQLPVIATRLQTEYFSAAYYHQVVDGASTTGYCQQVVAVFFLTCRLLPPGCRHDFFFYIYCQLPAIAEIIDDITSTCRNYWRYYQQLEKLLTILPASTGIIDDITSNYGNY